MARKRVSITYTALIWTGIVLALFGAAVAVVGLGGSTTFEFGMDKLKVKTTSTGLAILAAGALLAGVTAPKLPKGVVVLEAGEKYSLTEKVGRVIPAPFVGIAIIAVILLVASLWK